MAKQKINLEKRLEKLIKRGRIKQAGELQDYLFNKSRKFYGNFIPHNWRNTILMDNLNENETREDREKLIKQTINYEKRHLNAYLKGAEEFQCGYYKDARGYKHPMMYIVKTQPDIKQENNESKEGELDSNTQAVSTDGAQMENQGS